MRKIFAFVLLAILGLGSFSIIPSLANADTPPTQPDKTWGHMSGVIDQWGDNPALGNIRIDAFVANISGVVHEWARVFAMWTNKSIQLDDPAMDLKPLEPGGNFTVQFYAARLTNSTEIRFDLPGYDLYIAGNWTVTNITTTVTANKFGNFGFSVNITRTFEPVVTDAHGVLTVANTTTALRRPLELKIDGVDTLKGFVFGPLIRHIEVKFFDVDGDGMVNIRDLVKTAKRYKAVPGMRGYSLDFDFNGAGMIDIGDLTTLAANIEG